MRMGRQRVDCAGGRLKPIRKKLPREHLPRCPARGIHLGIPDRDGDSDICDIDL